MLKSVVFGHIADGNLHIFVRPSSEQAYAELNEHEEVNKIVYGSLKKLRWFGIGRAWYWSGKNGMAEY